MPQGTVWDSLFDASTLDVAANEVPYTPGVIGARGIFAERPIFTLDVSAQITDKGVTVVPATLRGAPGFVHPRDSRRVVQLKLPHVKTRDTLMADSWQGRRGFTDASGLASVETERNRVLSNMRGNIEATIEWHKTRALQGQIVNPDGSVICDLLSEFGVAQNTHSMALATSTTNVANKLIEAKRKSEAEIGAANPKSWVAFCSPGFIDAVRAHPSVETFLSGWSAASALRNDVRAGFPISGVELVEVRNAAGVTFIPDGEALLCPEGVPDLFETYFGPADYVDTVNTEALPIYARAEALPMGRGYAMEAQSNPLSVVRRPRAVVRLLA